MARTRSAAEGILPWKTPGGKYGKPVGGSKAKWFKEALGFTQDNMDDLAKQIVFDPKKLYKLG